MTDPGKAGPATICIAQDVEGEAFDYDVKFFEKRVHYMDRKAPHERELEGAVKADKILQKAAYFSRREALKYSEARESIIAFSEKFNVPLVETQASKSTVGK